MALAAHAAQRAPHPADLGRLERLPDAWRAALADVREAGQTSALTPLGRVVHPEAAKGRPLPAPGTYACRTIKLGSASPGGLPLIAYGWFRCEVTAAPNGELTFVKTTGSQRQVGRIALSRGPGKVKAVFTGGMALGDETTAPEYGVDPERDLAASVERIGTRHYRLVFPWPKVESKLDVLELKPVR